MRIGAPGSSVQVQQEIYARLDALEKAHYRSRSLCEILEAAGKEDGTISLAPAGFRRLLKQMIVDEDGGWVRPDPRLIEALGLNE